MVTFKLEGQHLGESIFTDWLTSSVVIIFHVSIHRALLDHLALVPHFFC